ncbi:MAG: primase-helicase family protein [Candidatus Pacearchaeota archaeon]
MAVVERAKKLNKLGFILAAADGIKWPWTESWKNLEKSEMTKINKFERFGIVCGKSSDCLSIDIDDMKDWKLITKLIKFDLTNVAYDESPTGSIHYYFHYHPLFNTFGNKKIVCIDSKGKQRKLNIDVTNFIMCAPSSYQAHKEENKIYDGEPYEVKQEIETRDSLGTIPDEFISLWEGETVILNNKIVDCEEYTNPTKTAKSDKSDKSDKSEPNDLDDPDEESKHDTTDKTSIISDDVTALTVSSDQEFIKKADEKDTAEFIKKTSINTLEQLELLLSGLNKKRFGEYTEWYKLLWAVARWAKELKISHSKTKKVLNEFCKNCDGYKDEHDVNDKYDEGINNEIKNGVTMSTVFNWLKDDCEAIFNKLSKKHALDDQIIEIVKSSKNTFSDEDNYYWSDFMDEARNKIFNSLDEAKIFVATNMRRVMAFVGAGDGYFIKKDNKTDMFNIVAKTNGINFTFPIKYYVSDKRKKVNKSSILVDESFYNFIKNNNLYRIFNKLDMVEDESINNDHNIFNMFRPPKAKKVELDLNNPGLIRFQTILKDVWAGGNDEYYNYIVSWLRQSITKPERTSTAIYINGPQGCGKSSIPIFIEKFILGEYLCFPYDDVDDFCDKFETNKAGKKMIYIEETCNSGAFMTNWNKMKSRVTKDTIKIEGKNRNAVFVANTLNIILLSNHKDAIYYEKGQRRYTLLKASSKYAIEQQKTKEGKDEIKKFWSETHKIMMNQEAGNMVYSWLHSLKDEDLLDPRNIIHTEFENEVKIMSETSSEKFIKEWLESHSEEKEGIRKIKARDLYRKYVNWCSTTGEKIKAERNFSMDIEQIIYKKRYTTGNYYFNVSPNDSNKLNGQSEANFQLVELDCDF